MGGQTRHEMCLLLFNIRRVFEAEQSSELINHMMQPGSLTLRLITGPIFTMGRTVVSHLESGRQSTAAL